jgi:WD40 repeat protein
MLTGKEIARMTHDDIVNSVSFSPDGRYVLSTDNSHITLTWIYRPEDLIALACSHVTRNLDKEEWRRYVGDAPPYPSTQQDAPCPGVPIEIETPTAATTP